MTMTGGQSLSGALVPTVKTEPGNAGEEEEQQQQSRELLGTAGEEAMDRDLLCPICMQMIKDAFLTACGHTFCYMCILTHLKNKNDCPCCSHYLTTSHLYPNFLLNKVYLIFLFFFFKKIIIINLIS